MNYTQSSDHKDAKGLNVKPKLAGAVFTKRDQAQVEPKISSSLV